MYYCQDATMYEKVTSVISWKCPPQQSKQCMQTSRKVRMQKKRKVVPGWNRKIENTRNKSLLWHYIWKQSERPVSSHIYSIIKDVKPKF